MLITLVLQLLIIFYYLYNKLCEVESAVFGHTVVLGNVSMLVQQLLAALTLSTGFHM